MTAETTTSTVRPRGRRILAQARFEAEILVRNGEQLLVSLVLPVLAMLALSASSYPDLPEPRIALVAPGVLALAIVSTAFTGQAIQTAFDRRYGVLVDHLVPGSKESRIAQAVERGPHGAHVRIVGHPHIDVWQCVLPRAIGIAAWPEVPRGIEWKVGVSRALGWPARDQADLGRTWQRILGAVHSYRDLDPALLGRVEELIDFVTAE